MALSTSVFAAAHEEDKVDAFISFAQQSKDVTVIQAKYDAEKDQFKPEDLPRIREGLSGIKYTVEKQESFPDDYFQSGIFSNICFVCIYKQKDILPLFHPDGTWITSLSIELSTIKDENMPLLFSSLELKKTLKSLKLTDIGITEKGVSPIADYLSHNPPLESLYMRSDDIGSNSAIRIAFSLNKNTHLKTLKLPYCSIGTEGAAVFAQTLQRNTTLEKLSLTAGLDNDSVQVLCENITTPVYLRTLNIKSNGITDDGAIALFNSLKFYTSLQTLNLAHNDITDKSVKIIANYLRENITLLKLNLAFNRIGVNIETIKSFTKALSKNTTLQALNLQGMHCSDTRALHFAKMLKKNKSLTILNLSLASIRDKGALALSHALRKNKTLTLLDLSKNPSISIRMKQKLTAEFGERIKF